MEIRTELVQDHKALIEVFLKANELQSVKIGTYEKVVWDHTFHLLKLTYDSDSEDALKLSYMSLVHMGIPNMLDDFLLKCGVDVSMLNPVKPVPCKRDMIELDRQWDEHRKKIGLTK